MKAWIARDLDNSLWLYSYDKPYKDLEQKSWLYIEMANHTDFMELDPNLFPEVKWEDEEPTEVEIIIRARNKVNINNIMKIYRNLREITKNYHVNENTD